jgi:hypothetical protein
VRRRHLRASEIHAQALDGHAPARGDQMAAWRQMAGGGEVLEHGGEVHLRVELMGTHRSGLERTRSMSHFRIKK